MHSRAAHRFLSLLLAAIAALGGAAGSRADALDGLLEVSSAYAQPENGVYNLFARIAYPVNDDIRAALKDGLTLTFDLDVVVSRERRLWLDETVAEYTLKRELSYHASVTATSARRRQSHRRQWQRATQLRHARGGARGARHRGCLAVPAAAAALALAHVSREPARRRASRAPAGHAARVAVLDRRLASRERVVLMVPAALRRLGTLGLIALWVLVSGGLLLLLALSVQNSVQYSKLQAWILLVNAIAVVTVSVLLARKIIELVRAFRAQVPGSRLTARTVAIFGSLVIAPLIIVYLFSLEFLNRGIDSWFKVEIKQGLTDALELSKAAMDVRMREYARSTELFANKLADSPATNWSIATDAHRIESGALEVVVYGALGQVLAASSGESTSANLPRYATPEITRAIASGNTYWSLEPLSEGDYLINTAAPIAATPGPSEGRFVVALYPVPPQLARLSEAVQRSYSQHGELSAQREPVKNSFRMTLTLVLLLAMLTAIYGAIYSAEKLTRPVQDLIAGTRAVGKGDFGTRCRCRRATRWASWCTRSTT
jgi:hypothetical protein